MKLSEIIAKLQELQATHGDIEVEILSDEGDSVETNIHIEVIGEQDILSFYY